MGKKKRLTIDFTEKTSEELEGLAKELSTTKVEAIRRAIFFMKTCFDEKKKGYGFLLKNENDGKEKQIMII